MIVPFLILTLFLLGQLGRVSFNSQEINVYLYEVLYFGWIVFLIYKQGLKKRISTPLLIFLGTMTASFVLGLKLVNSWENFVSLLYLVRLSAYLFSFEYVIQFFKSVDRRSKETFIRFWLTSLVAIGLAQYFLYSNLRNLQYLGWDPHLSRIFGQFFDTSVAGAVYGLVFIFLLLDREVITSVLARRLYFVGYAIIGLLTYSRGFMVSIGLVLGVYSLKVQRVGKYLALVVIVGLILVVFSQKQLGEGVNLTRTATIESRVADYKQGLELWQKHPVTGLGYNRIRYFKSNQEISGRGKDHAGASFHSSFLIILVTGGVLGLASYFFFLSYVARFNLYSIFAVLFLSTYSLFDNILLHPFILFMFPVLVGLSFTSRKIR